MHGVNLQPSITEALSSQHTTRPFSFNEPPNKCTVPTAVTKLRDAKGVPKTSSNAFGTFKKLRYLDKNNAKKKRKTKKKKKRERDKKKYVIFIFK